MSDELNVWAAAVTANTETDDEPYGAAADAAAAVIRDYGDKRYQQAIADVVEWLGEESARASFFADEITRRFGKDA